MSHNLQVNKFEWIKYTSPFNEDFIKIYNEKSDKNISLKLIFTILKNYMNFMMVYHFYQKE